jgi:hypothetical protein
MSRMLGVFFAMTVAIASMALAQGGGGMGGGRMAPPDHWITADSLSKAVGGDAALGSKVAPHLAEVDKIMKQAVADRMKMMPAGGGRPDQETMQAMRAKMQDYQTQVDSHLKMIRDGLDAKQQAAFDALQKPMLMRRPGGGGGMGGGRPPQ